MALPFNSCLILFNLRLLNFSTDQSEFVIKWCNDWAEFMLTTLAISGCESTISNRVHCVFFWRVLSPANVTSSESHWEHPPNASVCNARTLWSRAASLSANRPNYNRFSIDKISHPKFGVSSKLAVLFSAFSAVRVQWFPTLCRLSCWSMAFIFW